MSSTGQRFEEAFIRAVAPGTIELQHANAARRNHQVPAEGAAPGPLGAVAPRITG
jgi:hypothetical protein